MGSFVSRLVCSSVAFVYPVYASYKAIRSNDSVLLETWLMYWIVIGIISAVESSTEWLISWFPFYYQLKIVFIVWLSLPQVQGSTYIYTTYIHPFLQAHEQEIDSTLAQAKVRAKDMGLEYFRRIWTAIVTQLTGAPPTHQEQNVPPPPPEAPAGFASSLFQQYGPQAIAATSALLHPATGNNRPTMRSTSGASQQSSSSSFLFNSNNPTSSHTGAATPPEFNGFEHVSEGDVAGYSIDSSDSSNPLDSSKSPPPQASTSSPTSWRTWIFGEAQPAQHQKSD